MKVLKSVFSREETPCCLYSRIFNFFKDTAFIFIDISKKQCDNIFGDDYDGH